MDLNKLVPEHIKSIRKYEPGEDARDAAKLSSNENPRGPHPRIVSAVEAALRNANRYPPSGSPILTRALAARHGVTPGEVMVGAGSNEIIDLLVHSFVARGENIIFPEPSFIVYPLIGKICGCECKPIMCKDYRLDLVSMKKAIDAKTRMVFVCNPNNPTSTYVSKGEIDVFLDGLREDVLVVMDEAYIDYVDAADYPDSLTLRKTRNNLIILRTFSKFYSMAGIRLGYAVADPVVVETLHKVRQPFNVSLLAQAAGLAAIECEKELQPLVREAIAERKRVRDYFVGLGLGCPESQTNFVFVDLGQSEIDLYAELSERGVIIRRMAQFGASANTYRISIGTPGENDRLIAAMKAVYERTSH